MTPLLRKRLLYGGLAIAVIGLTGLGWILFRPRGPGVGIVSGNGRIEATEIDIATKLSGRLGKLLVREGDFVESGQPLAEMQTDVLGAQRDEARALARHATNTVTSALAQVSARQGQKAVAQASIQQRASELDAVKRRLARTEQLHTDGAAPAQELDDARAVVRNAEAALAGAQASLASAQASVEAAQAEAMGAASSVTATLATVTRIEADIEDSRLKSPRSGRVQYLVAQAGEVLAAGGKVLNLVDLSDVYLTFFLPEAAAGRVALGADVHLVLDALPQYVIPAQVSFVASTAQFTPKTVETASERQKLMFRVRARIDRALLLKHLSVVKTGLPGVAWIRLDPATPWPDNLAIRVPE
jgi:HlyD family secretion protein